MVIDYFIELKLVLMNKFMTWFQSFEYNILTCLMLFDHINSNKIEEIKITIK